MKRIAEARSNGILACFIFRHMPLL
jgi:hypothetical protein